MTSDIIIERLNKIRSQELKLSHLELHDARMQLLDIIIEKIGIDPDFDSLVEKQLSLYVGVPDSKVWYAVINESKHRIRNKLIAWYIDHPEKQ